MEGRGGGKVKRKFGAVTGLGKIQGVDVAGWERTGDGQAWEFKPRFKLLRQGRAKNHAEAPSHPVWVKEKREDQREGRGDQVYIYMQEKETETEKGMAERKTTRFKQCQCKPFS